MTTTSAPPTKTPDDTAQEGLGARALRALLTQRIALLAEYAGRWLIEQVATDWAAPRLVRWYAVE